MAEGSRGSDTVEDDGERGGTATGGDGVGGGRRASEGGRSVGGDGYGSIRWAAAAQGARRARRAVSAFAGGRRWTSGSFGPVAPNAPCTLASARRDDVAMLRACTAQLTDWIPARSRRYIVRHMPVFSTVDRS